MDHGVYRSILAVLARHQQSLVKMAEQYLYLLRLGEYMLDVVFNVLCRVAQ